MALNFNKYVQKAEAFINDVAFEIGDPDDKVRAARIMRAVLHAFRDRVTPVESLQLISQLPMLIKAIYVDGWKIKHETNRIRHLNDFIEAVRENDGIENNYDFVTDYEVKEAIQAVFRVLKNHVSEGEIHDIIAVLPAELKSVMAMA
ncbi:MAG: DUF2267 domain-containing protein [Saprospiraceae bacterium]|nr:DUF2267 domain-containing protein [Saprospiraceae bacterium]MCF8249592.1 DUF2267 domain-containing protein [Saprospiraceae bacterium]MCF8280492.1 DUF2267 domain-containing protein [Bacteroidales bacterium]MCF8310424.1 DUF2267 domain-containing protein [Saprospiraceae bacterium]MCF8439802.1 DUF2267 domain-containing protein [Saprospiraceae bacterium]